MTDLPEPPLGEKTVSTWPCTGSIDTGGISVPAGAVGTAPISLMEPGRAPPAELIVPAS
ncbi:unannotated protein [freshwater metagenome]|uniref:Unannotated protein n=1 Tax=freshwater metagenome TaxID=449393 RepID=A0A6J7S7X6_9ZZZZ